jgi:phosphonate transport system substrate-binding protein
LYRFAPWPGRAGLFSHTLDCFAGARCLFGRAALYLSRLRRMAVALSGALALSLVAHAQASPTDAPLIFGVFPNMTAKQTLEIYEPLAKQMEKHLRRRVIIYTARDFKTFVERTRQGDYDILLTAPHLAWLARQDAGYRPLLKYSQPTRGLLVVKSTSPYRTPDDLRGRDIATPDPLAVVTLAVQAELAAHGLRRNVDYQTMDYGSHLNAAMQVINGRSAAAMLGLHPFLLLPPQVRQQLQVLIESAPLSSLMYLTHPRLRDREANAIRRALLDFAATPEGKDFMRHGGYGGFTAVDGSELRAFRPYALQTEEMMQVAH